MAGNGKEAFFKELDDLDNLSDGPGEDNRKGNDFAEIIKLARKKEDTTKSTRASKSSTPANLVRTQSAPQPSLRRADSDEVIFVKRTPYQKSAKDLNNTGMKRPSSSGGYPENGRDGTATSKKRRMNSLKPVPESQQIFKGLTFCKCFSHPSCISWLLIVCLVWQSSFQITMWLLLDGCGSRKPWSMAPTGRRIGGTILPM